MEFKTMNIDFQGPAYNIFFKKNNRLSGCQSDEMTDLNNQLPKKKSAILLLEKDC